MEKLSDMLRMAWLMVRQGFRLEVRSPHLRPLTIMQQKSLAASISEIRQEFIHFYCVSLSPLVQAIKLSLDFFSNFLTVLELPPLPSSSAISTPWAVIFHSESGNGSFLFYFKGFLLP